LTSDTSEAEEAISEEAAELTRAALWKSLSHDSALALADSLRSGAESRIKAVRKRRPASRGIACKKGCAWCCYVKVGALPLEVIRIAEHLRQTLSPTDLDALKARIAATDSQTRGLSGIQRLALRIPCPLLTENGACSVHPVRPLACMGANSFDARRCRNNVEDREPREVVSFSPQEVITRATIRGIRKGLESCGLQADFVELISALRTAIENPDTADEWLVGKRPFPHPG